MRILLLIAATCLIGQSALAQSDQSGACTPVMNEVRIDQSGGDDDEYFELYCEGRGVEGFVFDPLIAYIVIGDGAGGSGTIEEVVDLGGVSWGTNDFFTVGESTMTIGTPDYVTTLNFENSDNVTHMFVSAFTGSVGDDLDTDDDCVLDSTPWGTLVTGVALVEDSHPPGGPHPSATECHYGDEFNIVNIVGPDGTFVPGHAYRAGCCSVGGGWAIGPFDTDGGDDTPDFANLIPVELTSFDATVNGNDINLNWETASETNNAGFEVQLRGDGEYLAMGFVDGNGTTTETQTYSHTISGLAVGTYTVRLKQIDFDGAFEYSPEVEVAIGVPGSHILTQAYPNPFNPQASFSLSVATEQHVDINLFNALGQQVGTIFSGTLEGGQARSFTINGGNLPSGAYFYRAVGANFAETGRVMLLK